jgi:hypothetical protein
MKLQPQKQNQQYLDLVDGWNLKEEKVLLQTHHLELGQLPLKEVQESLYAAYIVSERLPIHHQSHNQPQSGVGGGQTTLVRTSCGNLCAVYANNPNRNLLLPVKSSCVHTSPQPYIYL